MAYPIAQLVGVLNLPAGFSYRPYVPRKRASTIATANAVVVQSSSPQIVHGDGTLAWRIPGCYPTEYQDLYDLYNTDAPVLYTFTGYWGENLDVYFASLDAPPVRGRIFDVSGMFQVMCVNVETDAQCNHA